MSYDGTPTPGSYQGPGGQASSPQQIWMMQQIARALLGQQQPFMQSWTQPLAQMAQSAIAMQLLKNAHQSTLANAQVPQFPGPSSGAPLPPQQPPMPQPQGPPVASAPTGPTGNPSAISSMPGAPKSLSGFDPFFGLFAS